MANEDVWADRPGNATGNHPAPAAISPTAGGTAAPADGRRAIADGPTVTLVDAVLAVVRRRLLAADAAGPLIRRPVACTVADRKRIRIREVNTDRPVADLAADAVLRLLTAAPDTVQAADERAAKKRTDKITVAAPQWWWELAMLSAAAVAGTTADVVAAAIAGHLP